MKWMVRAEMSHDQLQPISYKRGLLFLASFIRWNTASERVNGRMSSGGVLQGKSCTHEISPVFSILLLECIEVQKKEYG